MSNPEVANPVIVRVEKRLDVELVDDGVLVPEGSSAISPDAAADSWGGLHVFMLDRARESSRSPVHCEGEPQP